MRLASVGELLWDIFPEEEHLGGAPANLAAHAARLGNEAWLLSAVGDDNRGREAVTQMEQLGVRTDLIGVVSGLPTGVVTVNRDFRGEPSYEILRPAAYDRLDLTPAARELLASDIDWLAFGTLLYTNAATRDFLDLVLASSAGAKRFYDINLREGHYSWALVEDLIHAADVLKLNEAEARWVQSASMIPAPTLESLCRQLTPAFQLDTVCITRGEHGCSIFHKGDFVEVPGAAAEIATTVGAGDAFSAMFLHGLSAGWSLQEIGRRANAIGAFVASQPGAVPVYDAADFVAR